MRAVFRGGKVWRDNQFRVCDFIVYDDKFSTDAIGDQTVDISSYFVFPGFVDVHVHLREPGFSYKETIATGTKAAARGGYTRVFTMPNLNPVPDSLAHLEAQRETIRRDAVVEVIPYGAITVGENGEMLSDMVTLAPHVAGFSDDGHGVQSESLMRQAMVQAKALNKPIVAHCEDNALLHGGYIHDGAYAKAHRHRGICSESEWGPIQRDIALVRETGCAYHVCHVSTKESVALIRQAKTEGLPVTAETAPHYLLLDDRMLQEDGRFKMNPPIRDKSDQTALLEAIADGTIDTIATDHAPHSAEEKSRGLAGSLMGIVGLETAFPLLYTYLVKPGVISLSRLLELLHTSPITPGAPANFSVWDLSNAYVIDPNEFQSKGKSTPFAGWKVYGRCVLTVADGKIAWRDKEAL